MARLMRFGSAPAPGADDQTTDECGHTTKQRFENF
jgi:hypothetical protein